MATANVKVPNPYDVSREFVAEQKLADTAKSFGIASENTNLEIKSKDGSKVLAKVDFQKVLFQKPVDSEDTPEARMDRAVAFFQSVQPEEKNEDGSVKRINHPYDVILAHVSYSLDLTERNGIRAREAAVLEGPDKAIEQMAVKLSKLKGIPIEEARKKARAFLE